METPRIRKSRASSSNEARRYRQQGHDDAQLHLIEKREAEDEVVLIFNILDQQHQAIQDIEARVEGIKKWITHSHSC